MQQRARRPILAVLAAAALAAVVLVGPAGSAPVRATVGGAGIGTPGPILMVRDHDPALEGQQWPSRIWTLVPGGVPVPIPNSDGAWDARWSPDGRVIAYNTWDQGLFLINPDGTGKRPLFTPAAGERFGTPLWSPDGSQLAFAIHTDGSNLHIEVASSLDGTREVLPTELTTISDWAADGSFWGAIQVNANFVNSEEIGVMTPDGITHKLTDTPDIHEGVPRLSPDGTRVAFVSIVDADVSTYRVEVMNVDGSGRRIVATAPGVTWPTWSPDGQRLLYVWGSSPRLVNVTTKNTMDLVEDLWDMRQGFDWAALPDTVVAPATAGTGGGTGTGLTVAATTGIRALALPDPSTVAYVSTTTSTIWPLRDGYRDTLTVRLRMKEPARSRVDVFNSGGTRVKTASFGWRTGLFTWKWSGRTSTGSILPAGRYRIEMVAKDLRGNLLRKSVWVTLYRGTP